MRALRRVVGEEKKERAARTEEMKQDALRCCSLSSTCSSLRCLCLPPHLSGVVLYLGLDLWALDSSKVGQFEVATFSFVDTGLSSSQLRQRVLRLLSTSCGTLCLYPCVTADKYSTGRCLEARRGRLAGG
jgi:hypothetical protein